MAELIERIDGVNGFDVPGETVAELIEYIGDVRSYLDRHDADGGAETYEELSISVDIGSLRIVGDIDHLRVTPEAFIITDYKTNRVGSRSTKELAEHYRPQTMSYALALLNADSTRTVSVNLRFTDVGVTESFQWKGSDRESLVAELQGEGTPR